eukprot:TRINITY_DN15380_c0_g1_i1.p1 TRINITY_DN15380_c0_g1~~TRINITY_DN15380_c0_g1_i1.p1  ORF type:complete len:415 (-),score=40.78 TRINITY_DN15380_c0_g1_i1:57-1301(-)
MLQKNWSSMIKPQKRLRRIYSFEKSSIALNTDSLNKLYPCSLMNDLIEFEQKIPRLTEPEFMEYFLNKLCLMVLFPNVNNIEAIKFEVENSIILKTRFESKRSGKNISNQNINSTNYEELISFLLLLLLIFKELGVACNDLSPQNIQMKDGKFYLGSMQNSLFEEMHYFLSDNHDNQAPSENIVDNIGLKELEFESLLRNDEESAAITLINCLTGNEIEIESAIDLDSIKKEQVLNLIRSRYNDKTAGLVEQLLSFKPIDEIINYWGNETLRESAKKLIESVESKRARLCSPEVLIPLHELWPRILESEKGDFLTDLAYNLIKTDNSEVLNIPCVLNSAFTPDSPDHSMPAKDEYIWKTQTLLRKEHKLNDENLLDYLIEYTKINHLQGILGLNVEAFQFLNDGESSILSLIHI